MMYDSTKNNEGMEWLVSNPKLFYAEINFASIWYTKTGNRHL